MSAVCRGCSRINPPDAVYCYYDGLALGNLPAGQGPLAAGSQPFFTPFVFPSGRTCRNFDELVATAVECWDEARQLLAEGVFTGFLNNIGRADLAKFAKQAAEIPESSRGLDDFLGRLPSNVRQPAKLQVQPLEIDLGRITRGETKKMTLRFQNLGEALLHGTVTVTGTDTPWLALGETPGVPHKLFECRKSVDLPLQIFTDRMRASNRPLEAKLSIESNGGEVTIPVRVEVPVIPFSTGVLAGAVTPREVAERARSMPKQTVPLFENGSVTAWYEANGWTYPIQGPQAPGLGGLQQFFEALGLTTPPRVEVSELFIRLQGTPGSRLEHTLQVTAIENRAVFAHATTKVPWLHIDNVILDGKTARILLVVPEVPDQPGDSLLGRVLINANGNQRFTVAVSLAVVAGPANGQARPSQLPKKPKTDVPPPPTPPVGPTGDGASPPIVLDKPKKAGCLSLFLLPLSLMGMALLAIVLHDVLLPAREPTIPPKQPDAQRLLDPIPRIALRFHDSKLPGDRNFELKNATMRFGLVMPLASDPADVKRLKRLTYDEWGRTNNTCLRVDNREILLGSDEGRWLDQGRPFPPEEATNRPQDGMESVWAYQNVHIRQQVQVVPGPQSFALDTCLVRYTLTNQGKEPIKLGLRFLLDTFIGANDGVPFSIPGDGELCSTHKVFATPAAVPDFIEALEHPSLTSPGTVARLQFRLGEGLEAPSRVQLGGWPNEYLRTLFPESRGARTLWKIPEIDIPDFPRLARDLERQGKMGFRQAREAKPDSALALFWDEQILPPGGRRVLGFAYGLGYVNSGGEGQLLLSLAGRFTPGADFTLIARVGPSTEARQLTLKLPPGFDFLEGTPTQSVAPAKTKSAEEFTIVTWRLRAGPVGQHDLLLTSSNGISQKQAVVVHEKATENRLGVFD